MADPIGQQDAVQPVKGLEDSQVEFFVRKGYLLLQGCFPEEQARQGVERAFQRLGCDPENPASWPKDELCLPPTTSVKVSECAPKAWAAICDLLGGRERILNADIHAWSDAFIINFSIGRDRPWDPGSPRDLARGWHKDGVLDQKHFLDSPECALVSIALWTDILPRSGGTILACDSIRPVARYLLAHPEGVDKEELSPLIRHCKEFVELKGEAGDVLFFHPLMLHAGAPNPSGRPRLITNTHVPLKEPMRFNRDDPSRYSPVELAVLKALKVERLNLVRRY